MRSRKRIIKDRVPYYAHLDTRLIKLGKSYLTLRDSYKGNFILGGTGSGKSSSVLKTKLCALLSCGAGGIFLTTKPEDTKNYLRLIQEMGRMDDVMVMDESAEVQFNLMDYCAATSASHGFTYNLVLMLMQLSEALRVAKGAQADDGSNAFFRDAAERWLASALPLLVLAKERLEMRDLSDFFLSVPRSLQEVKSPAWQKQSLCWQVLEHLGARANNGDIAAMRAIKEYSSVWLKETPSLGDKTRGSIQASISNIIAPLMSGVFHDIFGSGTHWVPLMARTHGTLLIISLPVLKYGALAAAIQNVVKTQFGIALQAEQATETTRPTFICMDEYHQYAAAEEDARLLATARSAKLSVIMALQDVNVLKSRLGNEAAEAIINLAGNRFLLANNSIPSNTYAADLIGKTKKKNFSHTTSHGQNVGGGLNQGEGSGGTSGGDGINQSVVHSVSEYETYHVQPSYFSHGLRTGGPPHKMVDMFVVCNGRNFPETGEHWIKSSWRQL